MLRLQPHAGATAGRSAARRPARPLAAERQPGASAAAGAPRRQRMHARPGGAAAPTPPLLPRAAPSELASQRCAPCEAERDAEAAMGLQAAFDAGAAGDWLSRLEPEWRLVDSDPSGLRIRRRYRTKNFLKGLELFQRFAEVAEAEGHHPDLALESWNVCTVTIWTHARGGLTDNDFILAAKLDAVQKADLLSKKPPPSD